MRGEDRLTAEQRLSLDQLRELAAETEAVELVAVETALAPACLALVFSLDCSGTPHAAGGIRLRPRERFRAEIDADFPFTVPSVSVPHERWAGVPHVQWRRYLCLYAAPSVEWVPADGLRGLVARLVEWLERASLGQLDPEGQPLHPPVAYPTASGVVVVRPDIGDLAPPAGPLARLEEGDEGQQGRPHEHRLLVAVCEERGVDRLDVMTWFSRAEWQGWCLERRSARGPNGGPIVGVLAVLTDGEMSFEYPSSAAALVQALESLGVDRAALRDALGEVAAGNAAIATRSSSADPVDDVPVRVLVGTPSRRMGAGERRQHLVCWQVDDLGREILEFSGRVLDADLARKVADLVDRWIGFASCRWIRVMEARPEVTLRRDTGSPSRWLAGKRVLVLGVGALGAPIAEMCVRGGAAQVQVVDSGVVTPGILERQPYEEADIGRNKALALADRLNGIRHDCPVEGIAGTAQNTTLRLHAGPPAVDLVIDATADARVASLIELRRMGDRSDWPPVVSVLVGHNARRGLVALSRTGATGSGRDILRRLTLSARGRHHARLADVATDFFPLESRAELFHPEPGCSSPTFTGSATELAALAGHLLDAALCGLAGTAPVQDVPMAAAVVRLDPSPLLGTDWFSWPNDLLTGEASYDYEVRISWSAAAAIRAECRRGARLRGAEVETGGLLIGQIDDACRVIWVDEASGPPPDSSLSRSFFRHGVAGATEFIEHHRHRSGCASAYLGMWHAHPCGDARPSSTDAASRHTLVAAEVGGPPRALMLIVGGDPAQWDGWIEHGRTPFVFADLVARAALGPAPVAGVEVDCTVPSWPGGWGTVRPAAATHQSLVGRLLRFWRRR